METTCVTCGAPTARDGWCPTCLTPAAATAGPTYRPPQSLGAPTVAHVGHRTGKSALTFGPVGRTLWTIGMLLPPAPFLIISDGFAGWGFAAMWWGVITPWGLRDLWRSGRKRRVL